MADPHSASVGVTAMRILLATPYFAPAYAFGGSVTVGETVVRGLLRDGHEVTVVTTDVFDEHSTVPLPGPRFLKVLGLNASRTSTTDWLRAQISTCRDVCVAGLNATLVHLTSSYYMISTRR